MESIIKSGIPCPDFGSRGDANTFTASIDALTSYCDRRSAFALAAPLAVWKERVLAVRRDGRRVFAEQLAHDRNMAADALHRIKRMMKKRSSGADGETPIPSEFRTVPMPLKQAAALIGYTRHYSQKKAAELLAKTINDGTIKAERLSRQAWVFDRRQFPEESHSDITPKTKVPLTPPHSP